MTTKIITRAALLLALTLVFQSLRFVIPITPFASTFVIGSLVNASLLVAAELTGLLPAAVIAVTAPITAYFQQLLPLPVFIFPVAGGNLVFICVYYFCLKKRWLAVIAAASLKTAALYFSFLYLLSLLTIPAKMSANLLFIMSWPQMITGVMGGLLAALIVRRLGAIHKI